MRTFREWRLARWKRRHQGFQQATVEAGEGVYHVRELTVAERLAFRDYVAENENNGTLAIAWLAHVASFEFASTCIVSLASGGPPTALARICTSVLEISGMTPDEAGLPDEEGPAELDNSQPGTVDSAKKNFADSAS